MKLNLKYWLYKRDITLSDLSKMAKVSIGTLSELANHKRKPNVKTLEKIAAALGIKVTDLYIET